MAEILCEEASYFARCLLMPEIMVVKYFYKYSFNYHDISLARRVNLISRIFGVEDKLAEERLKELGLYQKMRFI